MRHFIIPAVLVGLLVSSACQRTNQSGRAPDSTSIAGQETEHASGSVLAVTESSTAPGSLPVFVEVTQRTIMSGPPARQPPLQVGVAAFDFSAETGVLWVQPPILEASLAADVLIGVSSVLLTPGQSYENRELVQFPAGQPALIHILAFDANTGTVRLVHKSETYDLPWEKSLEFEQVAGSAGAPRVIITIVNHGRLSAIQPALSDGSVR